MVATTPGSIGFPNPKATEDRGGLCAQPSGRDHGYPLAAIATLLIVFAANSTPGHPVLKMDRVDVVRGGKTLLNKISLAIHAGERWALLGANGAGKSTLLGLCGALTHPTRGTVDV